MSFAELKTMVNSKLPGQNGFKTIDAHIEDVKTKLNQNYGDNFYVYTPYLNSVNVFTAPQDGFSRDFTIRQFVDNRDTDVVLCNVVKEGIMYADLSYFSIGNSSYNSSIFDRISGYAEIDFGYWKSRIDFNKPASESSQLFSFIIKTGTLSSGYSPQVLIEQYNSSGGNHKTTQVWLPHPIKVQKVKITVRYSLSGIKWSYINSYGNNHLFAHRLHSSSSNKEPFCIIGNSN